MHLYVRMLLDLTFLCIGSLHSLISVLTILVNVLINLKLIIASNPFCLEHMEFASTGTALEKSFNIYVLSSLTMVLKIT